MAWGYEKSFTIEHDDSVRKRINCKDCVNYDKEDKSLGSLEMNCVFPTPFFPIIA